MLNPNDTYRQTLETSLVSDGVSYGTAYTTYEIREVTDVRNLTCIRAYRVNCSQRVVIPNPKPFVLGVSNSKSFTDYPVLLSSQFALSAPAGADVRLIDYTPKTLNTAVMTSSNSDQGTNQSYSQQHTVGSSVAQTNSYGASLSAGFFGEDPTGSIGEDFGYSRTTERSREQSTGSERGASSEAGESAGMSIKDWGSYAYVDPKNNSTPHWVFGQEFPWDVMKYHYAPQGHTVALPEFVQARLFDSLPAPTQAFPPSQLSLFGIDFTMKATWQLNLPLGTDIDIVTINHFLNYLAGSHGIDSSGASYATLDPAPIEFGPLSPELRLTSLGLDPISDPGPSNGAVIGFIGRKFITPPASGSRFKILSDANTLQVTGGGFDEVMQTSFDDGPVSFTIHFKIVDTDYDHSLFLKHWITSANGCALKFVFNGDKDNPVYRHVDALEGAGGSDNLDVISLRNKDYSSIDYHDYLVMGMNTVEVSLTPDAMPATYVLRALAIGES